MTDQVGNSSIEPAEQDLLMASYARLVAQLYRHALELRDAGAGAQLIDRAIAVEQQRIRQILAAAMMPKAAKVVRVDFAGRRKGRAFTRSSQCLDG